MEGYQQGSERGERGGKGTENKKHNWQVQNRQGRLRIVQEMEKPKNLYVQPTDMNQGEGMMVGGVQRVKGNKGEKKWDNCNSIINKIY